MTRRSSLGARSARAGVAALVVGLALTSTLFVVVRSDVDRLARQRSDRPASEAALAVQHLMASVDQVLATANGVVAASGADPARFRTVLGPDVAATSTLAGLALVVRSGGATRTAATVGKVSLLAGSARAVGAAGATSQVVAYLRSVNQFRLGFAQSVAHGGAIVYLEIAMPVSASTSIPFALAKVSSNGVRTVVMGTVASTDGLTRSQQSLALGGQSFALYVKAGGALTGWFGLSLPQLVLLVGVALTLLATAALVLLARRAYAAEQLGHENRELDQMLERQRAVEAELIAWQSRFQTVLRDTPDVIATLDPESGSCEILNRANFLGHSVARLAQPDGLRSLVHCDDLNEADAHWTRLRDCEPEQVCETTVRLHDVDARDRIVRLRFSCLNAPDDAAPRALLGLLSDVTEDWANQLREEELHEALRRSQRLEAVGQLAGGIAHDFNNVLAAVTGSIELLMDDLPAGEPMEYALEIEHAAQRGAALVRQLLTYAQCDGAEPAIVDVNDIVAGTAQLLRRTIGSNVQLQVSTSEHACRILADPTHFEQVIVNLAVNARDAMPDGGILWIAAAIDFDDDAPENDRVVLSVTDTGTGIAPEVRERMFQPFVTTKETGKGTGLGLATVLSIVQASKGRINVVSQVDQGTTFEVSFARCFGLANATAGPDPDLAGEIVGAGRKILLVEDDDPVRVALHHILRRLDFAVSPVANARDALRLLDLQSFDLVLTDAVMPGLSGLELCEQLRRTRPDLRVILMSGYSAETVGSDALPSGVQRLRKPFTTPDLSRALRNALERTPDESFT
jgi:hypothetical protein